MQPRGRFERVGVRICRGKDRKKPKPRVNSSTPTSSVDPRRCSGTCPVQGATFRGSVEDNGRFGGSEDRLFAGCSEESSAAQERPLANQISECKKFIERLQHRPENINAEHEAETVQLEEARNRSTRLEAQAAVLPPEVPERASPGDVVAELEELKAQVATERERDEAL